MLARSVSRQRQVALATDRRLASEEEEHRLAVDDMFGRLRLDNEDMPNSLTLP